MLRAFVAVLILVIAGSVFARRNDDDVKQKISAAEGGFLEQKAQIEEDLAEGDVYSEIQPKDLKQVRTSLDTMAELLYDVEHVDDLDEDQKILLFNHQELVNTILTMAEYDSRTVCRRTGSTGSHFKTTHCETIRERRKRQERSLHEINQLRTRMQMINRDLTGPGGG